MPMDQWPTWLQQVMEAGYFAAMTNQPFNPNAMDEWKMGYRLFATGTSKPSKNLRVGTLQGLDA